MALNVCVPSPAASGTGKCAFHILLVEESINPTFLESSLLVSSKNLKNAHTSLTMCVIILTEENNQKFKRIL